LWKIVYLYRFSLVCTDLDAEIITVEVLKAVLLVETVCPAEYLEFRVVLVNADCTK
jgi:hypothetical protein